MAKTVYESVDYALTFLLSVITKQYYMPPIGLSVQLRSYLEVKASQEIRKFSQDELLRSRFEDRNGIGKMLYLRIRRVRTLNRRGAEPTKLKG